MDESTVDITEPVIESKLEIGNIYENHIKNHHFHA